MNVLVVADGHYYVTPDGAVYADSVYDYNFYARYLQAFDHVYAAIRAVPVDEVPKGKKISSGEGVSFLLLPNYRGPIQYVKKYFQIRRVVKSYCKQFDCAIFRIPAATSNIFCRQFARLGKPFAVEVVTDPWENFGPRSGGNRLVMWLVRRSWTNLVRKMCANATGASYVTQNYLQQKYPPRSVEDGGAFTASYSSVEIDDRAFGEPRKWAMGQKTFCISHVANYFSGYGKGHITLMNALKIVRDKGFDVQLIFVGDGPKRQEFEEYAKSLGISEVTNFVGRLANGSEVKNVIRSTDIFILPTFAEGLPRVLLEAMSEGLPCLSSPVCGIPEILTKEFLFDFDDSKGFADGIIRFVESPSLMEKESERNIQIAKEFASSILNERRANFYGSLRKIAEQKQQ